MMFGTLQALRQRGCLEACPTGALVRTEFDTVYVRRTSAMAAAFCVPACPFGVIDRVPRKAPRVGTAHKVHPLLRPSQR